MTTTLKDIFASLYRFTEMYDEGEDREAMTSWWYTICAKDIARVYKNTPGNKLIVNCNSLHNWEYVADRLLLISDAVAIRDTRPFEGSVGFVAIPDRQLYDRSEIEKLPLPPIGRTLAHANYASEDTIPRVGKTPTAMALYEAFPKDAYDWIFEKGREYHATGTIFYAPFIPPLAVELEFMKHRISIAELLGGEPLYAESVDFFDTNSLLALASLKLPTLEGVSLEYLNKIKLDHQDDFAAFSRAILKAINTIKSEAGSELFAKEVRSIQRDLIDDNIDKLNRKYRQITTMRTLSAGGVFIGTMGLSFAALQGASLPALTTGIAGTVAAGIAHAAAQIKEKYGLKDNPMHFLWRLHRNNG